MTLCAGVWLVGPPPVMLFPISRGFRPGPCKETGMIHPRLPPSSLCYPSACFDPWLNARRSYRRLPEEVRNVPGRLPGATVGPVIRDCRYPGMEDGYSVRPDGRARIKKALRRGLEQIEQRTRHAPAEKTGFCPSSRDSSRYGAFRRFQPAQERRPGEPALGAE